MVYFHCRAARVSGFLHYQRLHCRGVWVSQGAPGDLARISHEFHIRNVPATLHRDATRPLLDRAGGGGCSVWQHMANPHRQFHSIHLRCDGQCIRHEPHEGEMRRADVFTPRCGFDSLWRKCRFGDFLPYRLPRYSPY